MPLGKISGNKKGAFKIGAHVNFVNTIERLPRGTPLGDRGLKRLRQFECKQLNENTLLAIAT